LWARSQIGPVMAKLTGQSTCLFNGFANNFGEDPDWPVNFT